MYIKELEIQGFKSYKEQAGVDDFSPQQNTIVGRNGSGKSNFFRAIQFVLGEKQFSNLSHKERMELLHEGAGASAMSAHVQIVFDNSERRFPLDSDEVVLRRTIGLKKDEYFLNNKHVTKADVINLLESAGFSRSNPYYIVQQGKVNSLCLMKDEQRLDLLKEVAGTNVYEERRQNTENILADTQNKREKIQDVVAYIEERLDELKDEKEELEAFRSLDRRKRALQYTLYDLEMHNSTKALELLEDEREREVDTANESRQRLTEVRDESEQLNGEIKSVELHLKRSKKESKLIGEECAKLVKNKTACELRLRDIKEREQMIKEQSKACEKELAALEIQIQETETRLSNQAGPKLTQAREEVEALKAQITESRRRQDELESKRGRKSQFKNQAERDEWLQTEIQSVEDALKEKVESQQELENSLRNQELTVSKLSEVIATLNQDLQRHEQAVREGDKASRDVKKDRDVANSRRKEVWRKQQNLEKDIRKKQDELNKSEKHLQRSLPNAVAQGLDALPKIAKDLGINYETQIFGPLFELIHPVKSSFETAIEVAAGNQLTHVVVDCDETAARLMEELQRRRAGRVTFKPIAQIDALRKSQKGRKVNPDSMDHDIIGLDESEGSPDAIPLISKVNYPAQVKSAVRAVLGKVLLCRNTATASEKRRELRVNCVTLEGEEVNRSGALTGGYYDHRNSKLRAIAEMREIKETLAELEQQRTGLTKETHEEEQTVAQLSGKLGVMENNQGHSREACKRLKSEIHQKEKQRNHSQKVIRDIVSSLDKCKNGLTELRTQCTTYKTELSTPMVESLSPDEQQELDDILKNIPKEKTLLAKAAQRATKCRTMVTKLETELEQNLKLRKDELLASMGKLKRQGSKKKSGKGKSKKKLSGRLILDDDDGDEEEEEEEEEEDIMEEDEDGDVMLEEIESKKEEACMELDTASQKLESARQQHDEMEKEISKQRQQVRQLRSKIDSLKNDEIKYTEELQTSEKLIDKILTKRSVQLDKRDVSSKKIRELGSLSTEELDKVTSQRSTKALMSEIKKVNEMLQKYSHVNKKALDQFISFSDRRETLLKRKEELDKGEKSIQDLIKHLDMQKDEDILRTFRGVAKHFREVFKELVPMGKGELVMVTRDSKAANMDSSSSSSNNEKDAEHMIDEFIGISPRVSFTGAGERFHMRQLSGGQRALVALTLIFAIQRCDPAPFYLFDEIDQALDQNHRASVAAMIHEQAKTAQFITTTFRPELVQVADKCFGIQYQNKVSSMVELNTEEALLFVDTIEASEGGGTRKGNKNKRKNETPSESEEEEESTGSEEEEEDEDERDEGNDEEPASKSKKSRKE
uniref:Structural maintenance of chromosomes protein n=1 Tax=Mucochytrium quahogii TaxID=96639 RepID=A0A7S2RI58_9STRA|mmetsp:Transcript_11683/g.21305  ORF Transcript_11683/g.21305 Transcript_11683/m.21305 type:complete len:1336 (+) Transcript_11683:100-4107(+)